MQLNLNGSDLTYKIMGLFIWKIEAIFQLFLLINIRCTILLSCGIAHSTHSGNNIIQLFLQCSFMFVEQTKETVNWKWNMALLADLNWSRGQHVLFSNILCCFCYRFQILISMPSIINPNIEH